MQDRKSNEERNLLDGTPVKLGARKVALQLNTFLPQVHLTLVSVLQGVTLAILVGQFDPNQLLSSRTLLFVDSLLVIAFIWFLYSWAFVAFQWPFSSWHTVLQFLLATLQSLAFASLSKPTMWTLWLGSVALVGAAIRYWNTKLVSPANYERPEVFHLDVQLDRDAWHRLLALGVVLLAIGGWQLYCYSEYVTLGTGLFVLLSMVWSLRDAERTTRMMIQKHFEGTSWILDERHQLVERDTE